MAPLCSSFPRTRGDGPELSEQGIFRGAFPPHARGWTLDWDKAVTAEEVSPARAGMDRCGRSSGGSSRSFPRTRGDGPSACYGTKAWIVFPPHARGWTGSRAVCRRGRCVSPARAGMDRIPRGRRSSLPSFPRTRGDGPRRPALSRSMVSFPPHARGWTRIFKTAFRSTGVSPARAGMDLRPPTSSPWRGGFPRTRGDGPRTDTGKDGKRQFPPHARGWTCSWSGGRRTRKVSPARAGMDRWRWCPGCARRSFPRTRGDGPGFFAGLGVDQTFPPHARGWTRVPRHSHPALSVSPARAGMDRQSRGSEGA